MHPSVPCPAGPACSANALRRLALLGAVCAIALLAPLRAAGDSGISFVNLGYSYLAEDGAYHLVCGEGRTLVMTVDREYNLIGFKVKGQAGIAGYMLSPKDGNSSAHILFGAPPFPQSDEAIRQSPGFVGFDRRETGAKDHPVKWRQWRGALHLQSDATATLPVEGGQPGQRQTMNFGIVANFPERREVLEDDFAAAKVVDFRAALARKTPLTAALEATALDYAKWQALAAKPTEFRWLTDTGDEVAFSVEDERPWHEALADTATLRNFWRARARAAQGGIVSADMIPAAGGIPRHALLIAKYPLPSIEGWAYQAVALFPSAAGLLRVEVRSRETGTTGIREAAGLLVWRTRHPKADPQHFADGFRHDPYDPKFDAEASYMMSDAPEWDKGLAQHPLTKVRKEIAQYLKAVAPAVKA